MHVRRFGGGVIVLHTPRSTPRSSFVGYFSTVADRREQPDVAALGLARRGLGDTVDNSPGTALQEGWLHVWAGFSWRTL